MELEQFLELFNPLPGNHYIQITDTIDATTLALHKIIKEVNGTFHLALYTREKPQIPKELLEKFEFRAPSKINILDEFDLVMAKKMHMWGNGL